MPVHWANSLEKYEVTCSLWVTKKLRRDWLDDTKIASSLSRKLHCCQGRFGEATLVKLIMVLVCPPLPPSFNRNPVICLSSTPV